MDALDRFSEPTRAWFRSSFREPTAAQQGAWEAISAGEHTLVVAPTGSGKTLSAFLWSLDRLAADPLPRDAGRPRCRVLYVSPLKALAVDVERNLRSPLVGIRHAARRLGEHVPEVSVALRSGDTPAEERRAFARHGADVLITTPESLFLLLTSQARSALAGVETVIVDEVHAVAGTKRGAHLAVSLERLDALLERPAQRIGLSATVRPVEEVARFLAGGRPVRTVQPPAVKEWDLRVQVPVADMTDPGLPPAREDPPPGPSPSSGTGPVLPDLSDRPDGPGAPRAEDEDGSHDGSLWQPPEDPTERASVWPHVERRLAELVAGHRSTLVFANSRRLAERLTSRLNELADQQPEPVQPPSRPPARLMGQAGSGGGAPPVLARAHHGSVSKEHRAEIEDALKSGRLPAVVATSSLELGIDMGAVDQVVQVESPPSVASGLQRVGRAGHQVGAVSRGVFLPKHRGDLVQTAVVVERMRQGLIEALHVPTNPLDVLAQQAVAMVAVDDWAVPDMLALLQRSAPFAGLGRPLLDSVLDMLAGRYPGEDFADLRPRLVWDRVADTLTARRGAQLLAVTSGGTIPDRGLFAVMLATGDGPGRRVGELDEEMVYESRVGDVFTLGTSSWRIEDITHDQVLVTPAPGQVGRLPFWKGDSLGRPAELGEAVGAFVRETAGADPAAARERLRERGLDDWAADNLVAHLAEQREATGHLPSDDTVVIERFRDEIGDWRVVVHSPYGTPVHAPWALCVGARLRERLGSDVQAMAADDGIVLRLPDHGEEEGRALDRELADLLVLDPDEVHDLVTAEIGGSALFASRFRECAARALLLPRRRPDRRQPLWQQRQRSAQLLEVAARYPTFPIVLEAVREVVQDVYDVGGLTALMRRVADRSVRVVTVETPTASPFARSLLLGYVAQYLYEGDSPLAERRAAALSLDPALLTELLGRGEGASLADLLDPDVVARTEAELQRLDPERAARAAEDALDLLRRLGPLTEKEVQVRTEPAARDLVPGWLADLARQRQVVAVRIAGEDRWADVQDAARLRDGLGVALPVGVPATFLEPVEDPLGDLVVRWARTHGPFRAEEVAARLGVGAAVVRDVSRRLVAAGRLVSGRLRPDAHDGVGGDGAGADAHGRGPGAGSSHSGQRLGPDLCDPDVLRLLRRRSLAALRQEVEPVEQRDYAAFLPQWQSLGRLPGPDGVLRAVEQLAGARVPASALESLVLPARVPDYAPGMLDELTAAGEVLWQGHGSIPGEDGWVSLHLADHAPVTMAPRAPVEDDLARRLLEVLEGGGAYFFGQLVGALEAGADGATEPEAALSEEEVLRALWSLVWTGQVSGDTLAALRALASGDRAAHRARRTRPARAGRYSRAAVGLGRPRPGRTNLTTSALVTRGGPPTGTGRWALLPPVETDPTVRALGTAEQLLDRYGVLTRGSVVAEEVPGGFAGVYRVLAEAEQAGRVRRGYFVEHLGAAQFGSSGAIDRLRLPRGDRDRPEPLVLAATDPANGYGAALPWPERPEQEDGGHRPGRKAGALVVLVEGELLAYLERGGRTVLSWTTEEPACAAVAAGLAGQVRRGRLAGLTVSRIDGQPALSSDHPLAAALQQAGFHPAPQGLRLRR